MKSVTCYIRLLKGEESAAAQKQEIEPMARRTFNHYKQYLLSSRLLIERQVRGRKNTRVLEVLG